MKWEKAIVWMRRDLRLEDNSALAAATRQARSVAVCFVFDAPVLHALPDRDDRRLSFIAQSLRQVEQALREHHSRLVVRHGDPAEEIARLARAWGAQAVYANREYEPYAGERDRAVAVRLQSQGTAFLTFKDQVIFESGEVLNGAAEPYRLFTAYRNRWLRQLQPQDLEARLPDFSRLASGRSLAPWIWEWDLEKVGFRTSSLWLEPGWRGAGCRLDRFLSRLDDYDRTRNFPGQADGTSGLSAHLRFGTISPRRLVREARAAGSPGARAWLSELIWREFYQMILDRFPHVSHRSFRPEYDRMRWSRARGHWERWAEGRTGYPVVDAAMRHFLRTGWMHNRLRMVVASFLTKDLLVDWRAGEAYFARYLLDFDQAANNGNWQWCASTGCDAQPYFRIFHPVLQSRKFDAQGRFLRENLPELAGLPARWIHAPWLAPAGELARAGVRLGRTYPRPVVDHAEQRDRALTRFRQARGRASGAAMGGSR